MIKFNEEDWALMSVSKEEDWPIISDDYEPLNYFTGRCYE